jgi:hypothetical protein
MDTYFRCPVTRVTRKRSDHE